MAGTNQPPHGRGAARWAVFALLAAGIVLVDQWSKAIVDARYPLAWTYAPRADLASPTPVLGDLVRVAKSYNSGGLFGLFGDTAPLLAAASLLVIAFIVVYHARSVRSAPLVLTVALGLLLGGAVGNLIDRLRFGYVIDFVDSGIGDFRWYTFNVADAAISIALVLLIGLSLLSDRAATRGARDGGSAEPPEPVAGSASR